LQSEADEKERQRNAMLANMYNGGGVPPSDPPKEGTDAALTNIVGDTQILGVKPKETAVEAEVDPELARCVHSRPTCDVAQVLESRLLGDAHEGAADVASLVTPPPSVSESLGAAQRADDQRTCER